jgi:redox-sensitive bicupin YhaK (pirin superfamily)
MIDGVFEHHDSNGGGGVITNGDTQWMTAGSGILHIETPPAELVESGGVFHGIQLWVNLPKKDKFAPPRYQAIEGTDAKLLASDDGGALVRIIAGEIDGHRGPGVTRTPITLAHTTIQSGAQLNIPWRRAFNALVYVLSGSGYVGPVAHPIKQGELAVLGPGDRITVGAQSTQQSSRTTAIDVLLLGGQPIREPVFHHGPFVMNSRAELIEALQDYQAGKFGNIPPNALMPHQGGGTLQ